MSHPLSYSPAQRWHRRRRVRRFIGWVAAAIGAAYLCVVLHDVPRRLLLMREQAALEAHSWPAGHVVYSDRGQWVRGVTQWRNIEHIVAWNDISNTTPGDPMCFVHRLKVHGNPSRIVGVICLLPRTTRDLVFDATVIEPGTLRHSPLVLRDNYFDIRLIGQDHGVTIFGGQADPTDARHFTIGYEYGGKVNLIDGWLEANDTVKLEPRP